MDDNLLVLIVIIGVGGSLNAMIRRFAERMSPEGARNSFFLGLVIVCAGLFLLSIAGNSSPLIVALALRAAKTHEECQSVAYSAAFFVAYLAEKAIFRRLALHRGGAGGDEARSRGKQPQDAGCISPSADCQLGHLLVQ